MRKGMIFTTTSVLVAVAIIVIARQPTGVIAANLQCRTTRPEWGNCNQQAYVNAITRLQAKSPTYPNYDLKNLAYADFVHMHVSFTTLIHGTTLFFPWHRAFIAAYESALGQTLCYWDWADSNQNNYKDFASTTGASQYFGTNGSPKGDYCVNDGQFSYSKGYHTLLFHELGRGRIYSGTNPCLRRYPQNACDNIGTVIQTLNDAQDYASLEPAGEQLHSTCHISTGGSNIGDMDDLSYSPSDPIFFLHHAMTDRIWWSWQNACPSTRSTDYPDSLNTPLGPFGLQVKDVINPSNWCYGDSNAPILLDKVPGCKDAPDPPTSTTTTSSTEAITSSPAAATTFSKVTSTLSTSQASPSTQPNEARWLHNLLGLLNPAIAQSQDKSATAQQHIIAPRSVCYESSEQSDAEYPKGQHPVPCLQRTGFYHTDQPRYPLDYVVLQGHRISCPPGEKLFYVHIGHVYAKCVPNDFYVDFATLNMTHPGLSPTILLPPLKESDLEPEYQTPFDLLPPAKLGKAAKYRYAQKISRERAEMMGMDYRRVRKQENIAQRITDECNNGLRRHC